MKVKELVLAKCVNTIDPHTGEKLNLELNKYYVVEEINIGQSMSSVKINGTIYNSISFQFYNDYLEKLNIYHSEYSPYYKVV